MTQNVPLDTAAESPQGFMLSRGLGAVVDFARRRPLGAAGAAIVVLMVLSAVAAPVIAPYDLWRPIS